MEGPKGGICSSFEALNLQKGAIAFSPLALNVVSSVDWASKHAAPSFTSLCSRLDLPVRRCWPSLVGIKKKVSSEQIEIRGEGHEGGGDGELTETD